MAVNITCSGPNHASLSAQPGWRDILGSGTSNVPGHFCNACIADMIATQTPLINAENAARLAAFNAFKTATGMTNAQIKRLFDAHDRGET